MTSSRIIGPALAGLLSVTVGFGWCFTVDGLSYLAVLASLMMMRTAELRTPPVTDRARGQVRAGLRYVRRTPDLWIPLVMLAVIGTFTFNFAVVLPLMIERSLGGTDATYTAVYSVLSVGSLLGALAAAQRRHVEIRTMATAAARVRRGDAAVRARRRGVALAYPLALLVGFTSVWFMTASTAMMQLRSDRRDARACAGAAGDRPDRQHARSGGPLLGYVCDAFGARAGVALGGLAAIGAAAWGMFASSSHPTIATPRVLGPRAVGTTEAA